MPAAGLTCAQGLALCSSRLRRMSVTGVVIDMNKNRLAILVIVLLGLGQGALAQNAGHGEEGYKLCAGCHGFKGQGNSLVNAPALAGQEPWYLEQQLRNFRNGIRGTADGDTHGSTMALMTRGLDPGAGFADVIAYIGTMPTADPDSSIDGDVDKGRAYYAPCAACHGANAGGNAALNAPSLRTIDDWYQLAQLKKFKNGMRGSNRNDIFGQQMAPMAGTLPDEQAMRDVVAYINTLE